MVFLSIFLILILLCLIQSSSEHLTIDYRWGLHDKKPPHEDEEIYTRDINIKRPVFRKKEPIFRKLNSGSYKCYYEKDEYNECTDLLKDCPIQNHPDLSNYILKSEIPPQPDMSNYILKSEIPPMPDMSEFIKKEEIPEQPDMSEYIHKKDIKKYIKDCPTCEECPTCPIPIENEQKEIDLSKYMLKSECKKNDDDNNQISFGDLLPAFMKQKTTCTVEDDFRRNSFQKKC